MLKPIKIRNKVLEIPIIQGGMGIGVSLSKLASASINAGIAGTISGAQTGFIHYEEFIKTPKAAYRLNIETLKEQVAMVRKNTDGKGFLSVNILSAGRQYAQIARAAVEAGADAIISGAGLPMDLPLFTKGSDTANIPIISSTRALKAIVRN